MPSLDDVIGELRGILRDLQGLDLWPPWDAAITLGRLANRVYEIATSPPDPDPETVRDAADEWHLIGTASGRAHDDVVALKDDVGIDVWEGAAGSSFRRSVTNLGLRLDTVPTAAYGVESALDTLADDMRAARTRHGDAFDELGSVDWGGSRFKPWEWKARLEESVEALAHAVSELIGAYEDATAAHSLARHGVRKAMDAIEFPDHLPDGVPSVIDVVNSWSDDDGALDGSVLSRYDDAMAGLSPEERAEVEAALAATDDPDARALIMSAVASGLTGSALANYIRRLQGLSPAEVDALDPSGFRGDGAEQPDTTTCGSSTLVMSKMENDPAYALWMLTGYDPETGETDPRTPEERFEDESQAMHDRTNAPLSRDQELQFPWPESLGTQPWALAGEMSADGGSGVPGTEYGVTLVDPDDRGESYEAMVRASEDGHTVPIYVGDQTRPGHVVLVTATDGDSVTLYDPASGSTQEVSRDDWMNGAVDVAGWDEPWAVVVPD